MRAAAALLVVAACGRAHFASIDGAVGDGDVVDGEPDADLRPRHEVTEQFFPANGNGNYAGSSVAASGDGARIVSSQPGFGGGQGLVDVWRYDGMSWSLEGPLFAALPSANDFLGTSVAIDASGSRIVAGADHHDGTVSDAGAAYVFERTGTAWAQTAYIEADVPGLSDHFGTSVAISADGTTIAVGASGEDSGSTGLDGDPTDKSKVDAGAAYLFKLSAGTWTQTHYVKPPATDEDQYFGNSVSLSTDGSILAVGAPHDNMQTGAVYVIDPATTTDTIRAGNADIGDNFGYSVAIAGNGSRVIIGAPGEDGMGQGINSPFSEGFGESGAAYIFDRAQGWTPSAYVKTLHSRNNDSVGSSVAMSADGKHAIVGAPFESGSGMGRDAVDDDGLGSAGAVYQLLRDASGEWTQQSYIKASAPANGDQFGATCAMSRDGYGIVVGAPQRNGTSGGLYVYLSVPDQ